MEEQTHPYVEHIIIDGNSRDNTLEHIHHYQERNSNAAIKREINCISEPDEGLYDAMNKAIELATGDYIVFLNAGDKLHSPDTLALVAKAAVKDGKRAAVVYGDTDLVDNEGNFVRHRRLSPPEKLNWRHFKDGMLVCHQAFYARTDLARRYRYDEDYRYSADVDWCIRIMHEAERRKQPLVNVRAVVADYLSEGMTTKNHKASLQERFRIMAHHYGFFPTLLRHAWFVVRNFTMK